MTKIPTPHLDRAIDCIRSSDAICEFLQWMQSRGVHLCKQDAFDDYRPVVYNEERLMAEFFDVDLQKVAEERKALKTADDDHACAEA